MKEVIIVDKEQVLEQCYHCGNKGLLYVEGQTVSKWTEKVGYGYNEYEEDVGAITWKLLKCPVCQLVSLYTIDDDYINDERIKRIDYPRTKLEACWVPATISEPFEAALKVRSINSEICLISLRMVLEAICRNQGARGNTLVDMVSDVIKRGILPDIYKDACDIIRTLGNKAAHADSSSALYKNEVEKIITFLEKMIDYLYVLPKEIELLKNRIDSTEQQNLPF